jgi:hypothetical protein
MQEVKKYLEQSEDYLKKAREEAKQVKIKGDGVLLQDACGKAWLGITTATESLFLAKGITKDKLPKGFRGQRFLIKKFAGKSMCDKFMILRLMLHIEGYYEGNIRLDEFEELLNDAYDYLKDIKEKITNKKNESSN